MKLTFIETPLFSARWAKRQDQDALRALQESLLEDHFQGDPIPGCPLMRKTRFADAQRGKGKRGGLRVVYVHTPEASRIDLITVYSKDEKDDLTKDELLVPCQLARSMREEALRSVLPRLRRS